MTLKRMARKAATAFLRPLGMEIIRVSQDLEDFLEPGKQRDAIFRRVAAAASDWRAAAMSSSRDGR